jgi:hypothetical protein
MKSEVVTHSECACIYGHDVFSDKCLKRTYFILDPIKDDYKYLSICNELIRLKIAKEKTKETSYFTNRRYYEDVIESVILEHITKFNYSNRFQYSNELSSRSVTIVICSRPFVCKSINLLDAIKLYLDNKSHTLKDALIREIHLYLSDIQYKKYKTKYKKTITLLKRFDNKWGDEKTLALNELFINILELNIKLNQ